jgi:hypothetical protein
LTLGLGTFWLRDVFNWGRFDLGTFWLGDVLAWGRFDWKATKTYGAGAGRVNMATCWNAKKRPAPYNGSTLSVLDFSSVQLVCGFAPTVKVNDQSVVYNYVSYTGSEMHTFRSQTKESLFFFFFLVEPEQYCLCNQPEFGLMLACDEKDCTITWFHLACVGLKAAPKGTWICPRCEWIFWTTSIGL